MRAFRFLTLVLVLALTLAAVPALYAQGEITVTAIYSAQLRSGPGTSFDSLGVVPVNTSLSAVGRNEDASWIQVNFDGTLGWVASKLLSWSGDVNALPVGGVQSAPPASAQDVPAAPAAPGGVTATNANGINVRSGPSTSDDVLGQLAAGTTVALNARYGSGRNVWVRFDYNGQVGWLAGWVVTISGDVNTLLDLKAAPQAAPAAGAPASADRVGLLNQLEVALNLARSEWQPIASLWRSLGGGQTVSCANIPASASPVTIDASAHPDIQDAVNVLNAGVNEVRNAIGQWNSECHNWDRGFETLPDGSKVYWVPEDVVNSGVNAVQNAENAFNDVQNRITALRAQ